MTAPAAHARAHTAHSLCLSSFLIALADAVEPTVLARGAALVLDVPPDLGRLDIDGEKIEAVIRTLVSHAVADAMAGRVTITARRSAANLRLAVVDNGCGMDARLQTGAMSRSGPRRDMFDHEYRALDGGLALCRKLCRLMGGDLTATGTPGQGSCVTIRLPIGPSGAADPGVGAAASTGWGMAMAAA